MRKFAVLLLLVSASAFAQQVTSYRSATGSVSLTAGSSMVPSTDPTITAPSKPGILTQGCRFYTVEISAPSGQTLSGAGSIDIYFWSYSSGRPLVWAKTANSETVPVAAAGLRSWRFTGHQCDAVPGWLVPVANGVTMSGGSTLTITVDMAFGS
jgi:hypothetical protein